MKILSIPSAGGRGTTKAVELVDRITDSIMVCMSEAEAVRVRKTYGLTRKKCMGWLDFRDQQRLAEPRKYGVVVVDNADAILEAVLKHTVSVAVVSASVAAWEEL